MNHLIIIICQLEIIFSTYLGYYRRTRDASSQVQDNTGKLCLTTIIAVCVNKIDNVWFGFGFCFYLYKHNWCILLYEFGTKVIMFWLIMEHMCSLLTCCIRLFCRLVFYIVGVCPFCFNDGVIRKIFFDL